MRCFSARHFAVFLLVFFIGGLTATGATADVVYQMDVEKQSGSTLTGVATRINASRFVTDSALVDGARTVYLIDRNVTPPAKIVADVLVADSDSRIAVLESNNLSGGSVVLAQKDQAAGGQLALLTVSGEISSVVQSLEPMEDLAEGSIYRHGALYKSGQWGAPVLNNCGQLVGLSIYETGFFGGRIAPEQVAYAQSLETLKAVLAQNDVDFEVAPDVCLSDVEQAELKAEQAARDAEAAKLEKESADREAQERLEKIQQQAEQARIEQEEALKAAQEAADKRAEEAAEAIEKAAQEREELEKARDSAEELARAEAQKQQAAEQQKVYLVVGAAIIILILLLVFITVLRKRKQALAVQQEALDQKAREAAELEAQKSQMGDQIQKMQKSFHDILLDGRTSDDRQVRLKISGKLLAQNETQLIGRESAQVDYALTEPEVSRRHLQISLREDRVFVEDLQSQNGSWLNDVQLEAGKPQELNNNDLLSLGGISFRIHFL